VIKATLHEDEVTLYESRTIMWQDKTEWVAFLKVPLEKSRLYISRDTLEKLLQNKVAYYI
jgi:hypothetical protein